MNTDLLRMARRLWNVSSASRELNRRNQREWARAVSRLGDKWILGEYRARVREQSQG